MNYTTLISVASALAAIISAIYAAARVQAVTKQLQQVSSFNLTTLSNQHNWHLLDQRKILPPALPTWAGLTDDGWTWRTLHLNHLNLLTYGSLKFEGVLHIVVRSRYERDLDHLQ